MMAAEVGECGVAELEEITKCMDETPLIIHIF